MPCWGEGCPSTRIALAPMPPRKTGAAAVDTAPFGGGLVAGSEKVRRRVHARWVTSEALRVQTASGAFAERPSARDWSEPMWTHARIREDVTKSNSSEEILQGCLQNARAEMASRLQQTKIVRLHVYKAGIELGSSRQARLSLTRKQLKFPIPTRS